MIVFQNTETTYRKMFISGLILYICGVPLVLPASSCDFPATFQNSVWLDSTRGSMVFGTDTMTGYAFAPFGTTVMNTWECANSDFFLSDNLLLFRSTQTFDFLGTWYTYMCLKMTKITDVSYFYYYMHPRQFNANWFRVYLWNTNTLTSKDDICDTTDFAPDEFFQVIIKADNTAGAKRFCPVPLLGEFGYDYTPTSGTPDCTGNTDAIDVCSDKMAITFTNTDTSTCNARMPFAASEGSSVWCVNSVVKNSHAFIMVYNNDVNVDETSSFAFTCFAVDTVSTVATKASLAPMSCRENQTPDSYPLDTDNATEIGALITLSATVTCPITTTTTTTVPTTTANTTQARAVTHPTTTVNSKNGEDSDSSSGGQVNGGAVAGGVISALFLIAIATLIVLFFYMKKKKGVNIFTKYWDKYVAPKPKEDKDFKTIAETPVYDYGQNVTSRTGTTNLTRQSTQTTTASRSNPGTPDSDVPYNTDIDSMDGYQFNGAYDYQRKNAKPNTLFEQAYVNPALVEYTGRNDPLTLSPRSQIQMPPRDTHGSGYFREAVKLNDQTVLPPNNTFDIKPRRPFVPPLQLRGLSPPSIVNTYRSSPLRDPVSVSPWSESVSLPTASSYRGDMNDVQRSPNDTNSFVSSKSTQTPPTLYRTLHTPQRELRTPIPTISGDLDEDPYEFEDVTPRVYH